MLLCYALATSCVDILTCTYMRCEMHCAVLFQRSAGVAGALLHIKQGNTRIQRGRAGGRGMPTRGEARGNPPFQARDSTTAVIMFPAVSLCRCRFPMCTRSYKRVPPEILSSDSSHHDRLSCSLLLSVLNRSGCAPAFSHNKSCSGEKTIFYFQCEIDCYP